MARSDEKGGQHGEIGRQGVSTDETQPFIDAFGPPTATRAVTPRRRQRGSAHSTIDVGDDVHV